MSTASPATHSALSFTVEPSGDGSWTARERGGLISGAFASQAEALRFALAEMARPHAPAPLLHAA